jgi:hypothetical protein
MLKDFTEPNENAAFDKTSKISDNWFYLWVSEKCFFNYKHYSYN